IIMILLVLGGLFALVFLTEDSNVDYSKIHDRQKITNILSIISLMSSNFGGSMTDLLKDCVDYPPRLYLGTQSSCDYSKEKINELLSSNLPGRAYYFELIGARDFKICSSRECTPCSGEKELQEAQIFLSINVPMTLHLELCQ
ncbi:hypothetical protein HY837_06555, partial [archaeon]|nr:hypothetical protein [archaeon]